MRCVAVLLALLCTATAFQLPQVGCQTMQHSLRGRPVLAAEEGTSEPAAVKGESENSGQGEMPTNFLGVFDTTTQFGALGASISVAVLFGVFLEG